MKRLFLFLLPVMMLGLTACERGNSAAQNEFLRSKKYVWSYLEQDRSKVESELKLAGWEQNYVGKSLAGWDHVLYIYNRPKDLSWKPVYYDKYAYDNQRNDTSSLRSAIKDGQVYGEIVLICQSGQVREIKIFWLLPSSKYNSVNTYKDYSAQMHKEFVSRTGSDSSWNGYLSKTAESRSISYTDYSEFSHVLSSLSYLCTNEYDSSSTSERRCIYNLSSRTDYELDETFHIAFDGQDIQN